MFLLPRGQLFAAWGWTLAYVLLLAVGVLLRFRSGRWKNIDLLGSERPIEPVRPGAEAMVVE